MSTGVTTWSKTAATNATADTSVNWAEGMAPSAVNDSSRAEMASVAKWRDDTNGSLASAGGTTAYTLTTNQTFAALAAGLHVVFQANATNTGTTTLNVDSLGAKPLRSAANVEIVAGDLVIGKTYRATYYTSNSGEWILHSGIGTFGSFKSSGAEFITGIISPTQLSASQNDYAPTGFSTASILRMDLSADWSITGIAGGASGRIITLINTSAFILTMPSESASSTAANRFTLAGTTRLLSGAAVTLFYDGTSSRWRALKGIVAGEVYNIAAGGISSGNVQSAINELDTEKAPGIPDVYRERKHERGVLIVGVMTPTQLVSSTNDYAPTGFSTASVIRISSSGAIDLTGIAAGTSGRIIIICNIGANAITLKNESASSTAANRFGNDADRVLAQNQNAILWYDTGASRWKTIS